MDQSLHPYALASQRKTSRHITMFKKCLDNIQKSGLIFWVFLCGVRSYLPGVVGFGIEAVTNRFALSLV